MCQSDEQFMNILNQFWIATQLQLDVYTINNQCFHTLPNDPNLLYLFYMNEAKQKHNGSAFLWNEEDVSILCAQVYITIHVFNHFNYKMI
jgi:hypothetical protein